MGAHALLPAEIRISIYLDESPANILLQESFVQMLPNLHPRGIIAPLRHGGHKRQQKIKHRVQRGAIGWGGGGEEGTRGGSIPGWVVEERVVALEGGCLAPS